MIVNQIEEAGDENPSSTSNLVEGEGFLPSGERGVQKERVCVEKSETTVNAYNVKKILEKLK